jgi:hypothetical protein
LNSLFELDNFASCVKLQLLADETYSTPIYSSSLERKNYQAFLSFTNIFVWY